MIRLKREDCVLLHLPLMKKWYSMIESGEKTEEYRDMTQSWYVRIQNVLSRSGKNAVKTIIAAFALGRRRATMFFKVESIVLETGSVHPSWGEPQYRHFVIRLGERVEMVEVKAGEVSK